MKQHYSNLAMHIGKASACCAAVLASIILSGCSKTASTPSTPTSPYSMSASIGGTAFSRDSCVYYYGGYPDSSMNIFGWAGQATTASDYYPIIQIQILGFSGIGTYTLTGTSAGSYGNFSAQLIQSASTTLPSMNGSITITAVSPNPVGTFSFTTTSGLVVSGGSFTALAD